MNKVWNCFYRSILPMSLTIFLAACGNTGPDQSSGNSNGGTSNNGGGVTTTTSIATSSVNNSEPKQNLSDYTISVDKLEYLEGSEPEPNKIFPVTFHFNKPLVEDAVIEVDVNAQFGTGIFPGKILPSSKVALSKGASEFTIQLESYVDNKPEGVQEANWYLILESAGQRVSLPVDNGINIIDDDKMQSAKMDVEAGQLITWDLNGASKPFGGEKFAVTQVSGESVNFSVDGDVLLILAPAPNNYSMPRGDQMIGISFHVVSDSGEDYTITQNIYSATRFKSFVQNIKYDDYYDEAPIQADRYLQGATMNTGGVHHLIDDKFGPPVIQLNFLNSDIKIKAPFTFTFVRLHSNKIVGEANALISDDSKSITLSKEDWEKAKQAVDFKEDGIRIEAIPQLIDGIKDSEDSFGQRFELEMSLRIADKNASVAIDETVPDEVIQSGKLFLVLSDTYSDGPGDGVVFIKRLEQRVTNFDHLYGSDFFVNIVDLSGVYSGHTSVSLYDKAVKNTSVTIDAEASVTGKKLLSKNI